MSLRHLAPAGDAGSATQRPGLPASEPVADNSTEHAAPDDPPATPLDSEPVGAPAEPAVDQFRGGSVEPAAVPCPPPVDQPVAVPCPPPVRRSGRLMRSPAYLIDYAT